MLLGPTGTGKTILALQFLAAGAANGERGLFFGFFERPHTLLEKSSRIGLGLDEAERKGLVRFAWEPFGEASIDVLGERLLRLIREHQPVRLCIDGMQGFQQAVDFPERLRAVLSAIVDDLEAQHITTLYTVETSELVEPVIRAPIHGISAVTHNMLLLRHVESNRELHKLIGIIKLRDSGFDPTARIFRITSTGVVVSPKGPATGAVPGGGGAPHPETPEPWPAPAPASGNGPYVVIVDDEFGLAELIAEVLAERGYVTAIAINGELGLSLLRERRPALVLLDLMMPVVDGSEMLRAMRADPALATIPVVLMTALPEAVPAPDAGAFEAVLQKPFTPDRLFEVVRANAGPARDGQK
jgi:CheY-like chemotaxis protein/KaiC/GvpD/RAD55 family RecA-like ATPase